MGPLQSGAAGLTTTLIEAGDAACLAVNRSATNYLLRVDSLGFEQLLLAWTRNDTFLPAAESLLEPLRAESPELLHTLTTFLDHESGIQATAGAMGLHRNTVSARIQRAQDLLGIDFSAPEARLALHLACRALPDREL
ncbi:PucR family transcriptional regulator [Zhihengliuella halotolerans]|uniref:PucR family transcriptional regulator n=1 Tax=Zhihengliuella halotolerans TaxID=370736 RepID=UPI0021554E32|nr:helix-turn-helix domain-containing protein [Zhihengliuella halotolerans]